jgi:hypothetical protein
MANAPLNVETVESGQENEGPVERLLSLTTNAGLLRSTDGFANELRRIAPPAPTAVAQQLMETVYDGR